MVLIQALLMGFGFYLTDRNHYLALNLLLGAIWLIVLFLKKDLLLRLVIVGVFLLGIAGLSEEGVSTWFLSACFISLLTWNLEKTTRDITMVDKVDGSTGLILRFLVSQLGILGIASLLVVAAGSRGLNLGTYLSILLVCLLLLSVRKLLSQG